MGHLTRMQTFFFYDIDYPMISKLLLGKLVLWGRNTFGYFYSTFSVEWYMVYCSFSKIRDKPCDFLIIVLVFFDSQFEITSPMGVHTSKVNIFG